MGQGVGGPQARRRPPTGRPAPRPPAAARPPGRTSVRPHRPGGGERAAGTARAAAATLRAAAGEHLGPHRRRRVFVMPVPTRGGRPGIPRPPRPWGRVRAMGTAGGDSSGVLPTPAGAGGRPRPPAARRPARPRRPAAARAVLRHQPRAGVRGHRAPLRPARQPVLARAARVRLHPAPARPGRAGAAAALGLGMTNVAPRATARADELDDAELVAGGDRLRALVAEVRPAWLAVVGVGAYRVAFAERRAVAAARSGRSARPGCGCCRTPAGSTPTTRPRPSPRRSARCTTRQPGSAGRSGAQDRHEGCDLPPYRSGRRGPLGRGGRDPRARPRRGAGPHHRLRGEPHGLEDPRGPHRAGPPGLPDPAPGRRRRGRRGGRGRGLPRRRRARVAVPERLRQPLRHGRRVLRAARRARPPAARGRAGRAGRLPRCARRDRGALPARRRQRRPRGPRRADRARRGRGRGGRALRDRAGQARGRPRRHHGELRREGPAGARRRRRPRRQLPRARRRRPGEGLHRPRRPHRRGRPRREPRSWTSRWPGRAPSSRSTPTSRTTR